MLKRSLLSLACLFLLLPGTGFTGPQNAAAASTAAPAMPVSITQSGNAVTADNGLLRITYDLATGRGDFLAGTNEIMTGFYSEYEEAGNAARRHSYDSGTRTASWSSIGTDAYGTNGQQLTITHTSAGGDSLVWRIAMYEDKPYVLADMTVSATTAKTITYLAPFAADNLDIGPGLDKRIYTTPYTNNYDFGIAPVNDFGNSQNGYDRALDEPVPWTAFNGISYWVTSLFDETGKHGFVAGAATSWNWKSMQHLGEATTANGPLSSFAVYNGGGRQSGTTVNSDRFFLGYFADYREGLETFAEVYTVAEPKLPWAGEVPLGFNTYYAYYSYPTADAMFGMTDYYVDHLKDLGYTYINLDCCYQGEKGEDTVTNITDFVDYVHSKGLKAGAYSVPFAIWDELTATVPGTSYTFYDIAIKDASGTPIKSYINTYMVDATHPAGRTFLHDTMMTYHVNPGFDYVKLDFIDFGMYEGKFYDTTKNGMQNFRIGMEVMREALLSAPQDIYINESIAPLLPNGYAHGRRSGVDTTIGLETYPGIERQALNSAASWWTNGSLYTYNDPDMAVPEMYVEGFNKMTLNEGTLLTTAIAMGGGHFLLGDLVPFVSEDRMKLLLNEEVLAVVKNGKAARPVAMTNYYHHLEHSPSAIYLTEDNGDRIVGLSNWDHENPQTVSFTFADIGLSSSAAFTLTELYSKTKVGSFSGGYSRILAPGESVMLRVSSAPSAWPGAAVNLAAGITATASSTWSAQPGFEAAKLTDGSLATRWSGENGTAGGEWVEVDFGSGTALNRVEVFEYGYGNQNFQIDTYALQYWNGTAYQDLTKGFAIGDRRVFDFPTVTTAKIRLFIKSAQFIPSIREIAAYNVAGNSGYAISQDASNSPYASYSDIRAKIQRMQTFTLTGSVLPKLDVYVYESYVNKLTEDNLYLDIVELNSSDHPVRRLFTAALPPYNVSGSPKPYSIYPRLNGLDPAKHYAVILRSPNTLEDGSTSNKFGFAYSDSNPLPGGYERISFDGGVTWSTENGGNRDLIITIYQQ